MQEELDVDKCNLQLLSEDDTRNRIAAIKGGSISYECSILTETSSGGMGLKCWLKHERWWLIATTVMVLMTCTLWTIPGDLNQRRIIFLVALGPTLGLLLALCIGTSWKSRLLLFSVSTILTWIIPIILLVLY